LTNVLQVDYLTPDAALRGGATWPPQGKKTRLFAIAGHRRPASRVRRVATLGVPAWHFRGVLLDTVDKGSRD
jgi:hypothetical protein